MHLGVTEGEAANLALDESAGPRRDVVDNEDVEDSVEELG
jgi:hypothetical protein